MSSQVSVHCIVIASAMIVLVLLAGCEGAMSVPTPVSNATSPSATPVPPTVSTASPTATPVPPTPVGDEIWTRTYGGSRNTIVGGVLLADDGGYFIAGTTNLKFEPEQRGDVYLIRTDAAGKVVWDRAYGKGGYHESLGVAEADDGNLLIVGVATTTDTQGMDAYLLKVDPAGNAIWSRTYGGPLDEFTQVIARTPDGGYVLGGNIVDPNDSVADPGAAGYGGFAGRSNLYLLKVDAAGNELWSRAYESRDNIIASDGCLTPDGGFLTLAVVTHFPDPDDDILLMKLDGNGDEAWSRTWKEGKTYPYDLVQTADGNYLITSSYAPLEGSGDLKEDFLFIKVDPEGNEIWRSTFGDPGMIDYGVVLAEATGGGYVAVGGQAKDHYARTADIKLVKIDEDGELVWERTRAATHTMLSTLLQHPDGGFVVAGGMSRGSASRSSVFIIVLIKTDSEGKMAEHSTPG